MYVIAVQDPLLGLSYIAVLSGRLEYEQVHVPNRGELEPPDK